MTNINRMSIVLMLLLGLMLFCKWIITDECSNLFIAHYHLVNTLLCVCVCVNVCVRGVGIGVCDRVRESEWLCVWREVVFVCVNMSMCVCV